MKVSYIIPHKNRTNLLRPNLVSLCHQTNKNFDIIIVDNSDEAFKNELISLCREFRSRGLTISTYFIEPSRCKHAHLPFQYSGNYNPALAQNLGVKKSTADVIVLTSPEVINANTNVDSIINIFSTPGAKFILGWIDELPLYAIPDMSVSGISLSALKALCPRPGPGARCRPDAQWSPWNYFLGMMRREDFIRIGGVDERYMGSIAWEDNEFAKRCEMNGFPAQLDDSVAGIHLAHSRGYQVLDNSNKALWEQTGGKSLIANVGDDWGSENAIIGVDL